MHRAGRSAARGQLGLALLVRRVAAGCGQAEPETPPHLGGVGQSTPAACDLYAATGGSDSAPGSRARPLQTAQRLVDALDPGQTGCFRGGTFAFSLLELSTPSVTLAPYEDEAVTLEGEIKVLPAGAGSTIQGLRLNGSRRREPDRPQDLRRRRDSARQRDHQRPHQHLRLGRRVTTRARRHGGW